MLQSNEARRLLVRIKYYVVHGLKANVEHEYTLMNVMGLIFNLEIKDIEH